MAVLLLKKMGYFLIAMCCITFLSFILANFSPVDPAEAYAKRVSRVANKAMIEHYREELGFNKPVPEQYLSWLCRIVHFDFGHSYITKKPVLQEMRRTLPYTLSITAVAMAFLLLFSSSLGILAAYRGGKWDTCINAFCFLFVSIPSYFLGLLILLLFAVKLQLIPVIGHENPAGMICAAFVLALPMIGMLTRILRSLLLEDKHKDYVEYARARGVREKDILIRHSLRNAAPTCVVMFGQNIGYLIAGTAVVETIFSVPGIGDYALKAAIERDFPVINGYLLMMALTFVLCNLAAEICGYLLDPALRREDLR